MKWIYKILRTLAVTLIAMVFLIPAVLYVVVSLPFVQDMIARRAEHELSTLLDMKVEIGGLSIMPFNRATLRNVAISDSLGRKAIEVDRLGAGINLWQLAIHDRIVVDYAEVIGLDAKLTRDSVGSPLNIQPMIDALMPKDKTKPPTLFDLRIDVVVMRTSNVSYDVLSAPRRKEGFDVNHIAVSGLRADLRLPRLKNDDFIIDLRRLAMAEQSGFRLENLSGSFHISNKELTARNVVVQMPGSKVAINDQQLTYNGFEDLSPKLRSTPLLVEVLPKSHVATKDIEPFVPQLTGLDMVFDIDALVSGTIDDIKVDHLNFTNGKGLTVSTAGSVAGLTAKTGPNIDVERLLLEVDARKMLEIVGRFASVEQKMATVIGNLGNLKLTADGAGNRREGNINMDLSVDGGHIVASGMFSRPLDKAGAPVSATGDVKIESFDGSSIFAGISTPVAKLTELDADLTFDIKTVKGGLPDGTADMTLRSARFNTIEFADMTASVTKNGYDCEAHILADNQLLYADADIRATIGPDRKSIDLSAEVRDFDMALVKAEMIPGSHKISVDANALLNGRSVDDVEGWLTLDGLRYERSGREPFVLNQLRFDALRSSDADSLLLTSEVVDAQVVGHFHLTSLATVAKAIVGQTMPVFVGSQPQALDDEAFWEKTGNQNVLTYNVDVKTIEPLAPLVNLPFGMLQDIRIFGDLNSDERSMSVNLDAPYLSQGNKLIENTSLMAMVRGLESEGDQGRGNMNFTTTVPTKNGPMTLIATASATNDCVDTRLEWKIDRKRDFSGDISLTSCFMREGDDRRLAADINVNPSRAVFNDTVWTIDPSTIAVHGKVIEVDLFRCWRDNQYITLNGKVSEEPTDTLTLSLNDVNLDYVFETLDIPTAMFGGNATGNIYATELLTGSPHAFTPKLDVRLLTYNHSLLGNAEISSGWNNATKGILLDADIHQPNGRMSNINGAIYPLADSLNLRFDCDKIQIGFLKPYMSAFASDVGGYASGKARLYGTFKLIDMVGDVYGEDVSLTLGFTNTTYTTTDSVHFRPGRIQLDNLLLKDKYGQTARLNGWVTHECFKSPRFDFEISQARDLLVYDMPENNEFQWYGRVFGNGSARVVGAPGIVDISVDMTTARNSTFTYVLSDVLSAQEYNFITFRDRDQARKDSIAAINAPPSFVREFRERMAQQQNQNSAPSKYKMNFNIGITPQALITLVMDPVGGDRILAHGNGTLNMSYDSANEDLRMNGTYTLDDGKYNFTLQDIILKDFIIEPGSSIAFNGDPYAAQLNLTAKFQTKANLTDLDESFIDDKELNRTAVPVNAMMTVRGDMRQPDITFDLDFPTLTEDPKRKIRSIINTEEMMNRQIIYLLALGRFYTPDYMNATRGNELVSVASSTISSQLGNILGQLSDNWNIAPNFRSDRGDFSDVEFDVALSSRLLDNRLLLNGNFGYRDKSLNNNSFIGDFDIEYLLNRSGSLRLKAYNRYNDQNYYLKSALTTQGVGLVFKRDFDSLTTWLRPWLHRRKAADSIPVDATPADTATVAIRR